MSLLFLGLFALNSWSTDTVDEETLFCKAPSAQAYLLRGFARQKEGDSEGAKKAYLSCLEVEAQCVSCLYEIGWSYWKLGEWDKVIASWEKTLGLNPKHRKAVQYLPTARENKKIVDQKNKVEAFHTGTLILSQSQPADAPVLMTFLSRWQAYNPKPANALDHFDLDVDSPKSVTISPDSHWAFVQSLEGGKTIAFNALDFTKSFVYQHKFTAESAALFAKKAPFDYKLKKGSANVFQGKPVEGVLSHRGKYLWVTYYRRNFDPFGQMPSAMALIHVAEQKIIKVFGTGPIAKYVQVSPDGRWLAVSHWGDNTVGLYRIEGDDPAQFREEALLVVEKRLDPHNLKGNRDRNCGFCLRGLAFSADSRYLFVARMRKGGIAAFDLAPIESQKKARFLGTVFGISPGPRDLQLTRDGQWLFSGCNATGFVAKIPVAKLIETYGKIPVTQNSIRVQPREFGVVLGFAGNGVRSIKLTSDDKYVFASVNKASEVTVLRALDLKIISRIAVDSYPVGLSLSPDDGQLWVTSQGRDHLGGNSVSVYGVKYVNEDQVLKGTEAHGP